MSGALTDIIKSEIAARGPIGLERYMALALSHPDYGYYMKKDPLGRGGDFTTAPEISQMFGEMIGAWVADTWMKMGSPSRFVLLECGPGRGTLMADMMRATANVAGFHDACAVHLIETSPVLKAMQGEALKSYQPVWHDALSRVADDCPMIVVANEFFDALPVRQVIWKSGGWRERVVDIDGAGFGFGDAEIYEDFDVDGVNALPKEGDIYEVSPEREAYMKALCGRLEKQRGAALIIDYGHLKSAFGDSFQAVYQHQYCDVLAHVGDADLTSHVDFDVLGQIAGDAVDGVLMQGAFLQRLGIGVRAKILSEKDPNVLKDLHRLVNPDAMGTLFKVMGVRYGIGEKLAGF